MAVKSGRSAAGARATSSHTGALISASDVTVDALFRQAGVIRTDTLAELFDVGAAARRSAACRAGRRVAIVTNAGGPGILCADTCEAHGLEVRELSGRRAGGAAPFLPAEASLAQPGRHDRHRARRALPRGARKCWPRHDCADAIIAIFIPPLATRTDDVARAIRSAVDEFEHALPVVSVFMTSEGKPVELRSERGAIPPSPFPRTPPGRSPRTVDYGVWRESPDGRIPAFDDARPEEAAAVIASALGRRAEWLAPQEIERLLACYGLPLVASRAVADPGRGAQAPPASSAAPSR